MTEREQIERGQPRSSGVFTPVPAARPLTDFSWEQIGDDLVILDGETMQYHTLNGVAQRIWRSCDGIATVETIAVSTGLPADVVETSIAELGEASLLTTSANTWSVSMSRRRAAKLIAAGAVGAVGVPVVLSITAPSHQASASGTCADSIYGTSCGSIGDWCNTPSFGTVYCCHQPGGSTIWYLPAYACPYGWDCGSVCPTSGAPEEIQIENFDVTDASIYNEEVIESDPLLGDENGNVDLKAIQSQESVTDPPVDIQAQPEVQQSAPEVVVDTAPADESVDTSSGDEGTPADEDNG